MFLKHINLPSEAIYSLSKYIKHGTLTHVLIADKHTFWSNLRPEWTHGMLTHVLIVFKSTFWSNMRPEWTYKMITHVFIAYKPSEAIWGLSEQDDNSCFYKPTFWSNLRPKWKHKMITPVSINLPSEAI